MESRTFVYGYNAPRLCCSAAEPSVNTHTPLGKNGGSVARWRMQGTLPIGVAPRTPCCANLDMQVQQLRLSMGDYVVASFEGGSCMEASVLVWWPHGASHDSPQHAVLGQDVCSAGRKWIYQGPESRQSPGPSGLFGRPKRWFGGNKRQPLPDLWI